jgi:transposase-like protein
MEKRTGLPTTLQEAIAYFSDPQHTFDFSVAMRWPKGQIECPRCASTQHSFIKTRRIWFCKGCKKQFTVKVGTIFEDSPLGMDKWMIAVWLISNCKNGVSSYEIASALGITQKSAWHMMHRIRRAMQDGSFRNMSGEIEADETFVGGLARNMHASRRNKLFRDGTLDTKTIVMGLLERHGPDRMHSTVRTKVLPSVSGMTLRNAVMESVEPGSTLYTDENAGYKKLGQFYAHEFINHAEAYAKGAVHTNGLENFWSLLKRGIKGTYVSVEPFHMFRYLDEQAFRFNNRKATPLERFMLAMENVWGQRVTWNELTGKDARQATSIN